MCGSICLRCFQSKLCCKLIWSMTCVTLESQYVPMTLKQHACNSSDKFSLKDTQKTGAFFMKWQTHTVTGSAHKRPCEWNERVFAGCENILQHAPLQTLLLINLSALCFESNLVQPPEKHSAVSGAWLCFEGRGLLPSQSTASPCCKNTSSQCWTLACWLHTSHINTHTRTHNDPGMGLMTASIISGQSFGLHCKSLPWHCL